MAQKGYFDSETKAKLYNEIECLAANSSERLIAAFDADGTLWGFDCGEAFLSYLQDQEVLGPISGKSPVEFYESMRWGGETKKALKWLAQISAGRTLEEVRKMAAHCFDSEEKVPVFPDMRDLINKLKSSGFEVYIVSASPKWAVEAAAVHVGVDKSHVIGLMTKIQNNKLTEEMDGPVTSGEGKVEALLHTTQGFNPTFAAGNTHSDLPLMESAQIRLAIASSEASHPLFKVEQEVQALAKEKAWYFQEFK